MMQVFKIYIFISLIVSCTQLKPTMKIESRKGPTLDNIIVQKRLNEGLKIEIEQGFRVAQMQISENKVKNVVGNARNFLKPSISSKENRDNVKNKTMWALPNASNNFWHEFKKLNVSGTFYCNELELCLALSSELKKLEIKASNLSFYHIQDDALIDSLKKMGGKGIFVTNNYSSFNSEIGNKLSLNKDGMRVFMNLKSSVLKIPRLETDLKF